MARSRAAAARAGAVRVLLRHGRSRSRAAAARAGAGQGLVTPVRATPLQSESRLGGQLADEEVHEQVRRLPRAHAHAHAHRAATHALVAPRRTTTRTPPSTLQHFPYPSRPE